MAFANIRMPEEIEKGAHGGAQFETTIVTMSGGVEQRNIDWQASRQAWDIGYGIQSATDFANVRAFYYARRGSAYAFRFKDWSDYQCSKEPVGSIVDGVKTIFQIVKTYEAGGPNPYVRNITHPVDGNSLAYDVNTGAIYTVANTIQVFFNNVLQVSGYTVDGNTGLITFTVAPTNGTAVTVTCEFDTPARFDTDNFDLSLELFNAGIAQNLKIIELVNE